MANLQRRSMTAATVQPWLRSGAASRLKMGRPGRLDAGQARRRTSFALFVSLVVPLYEFGGRQDLQHHAVVFVPNGEQDGIVDSGLTGIGECPLRGGACHAVQTAVAPAIERVELRGRWSRAVDLRIIPALGGGEFLQVELVAAVPVDFQAVRQVGLVAVQLKAVGNPRAD